MSWPETGWAPGHPKKGYYYFFRLNGYGPFESDGAARNAAAEKHGHDRYWHGKGFLTVREIGSPDSALEIAGIRR